MLKKTAALMLAASLLAGVSAYAESTAYSSFSSYSYSSVTNSDGKTVTRSSSGSYQMNTEGDTLTLSLESNHTTGYSWEIHGLDRSALQAKNAYVQDKAPINEEGEPMVGVGGRDIFTFKALKPGTATLTLSYEQPWKGGDKGASYDLTITAGEDNVITGVSLSTHEEKDPDQSDRVIIISLVQGTSTETLKALGKKYNMDLMYDMKNLSMASFTLKTPLSPADMKAFLSRLEKEEVILGAWPDRKMYLQDVKI
jgi:predicted secreted protein